MAWQIDKAHSSVEFSVRHMGISTVRGRFEEFDATFDLDPSGVLEAVHATIQPQSINTREPKRDAHLKSGDFFDADKYPITFESSRVSRTGNGTYRIVGDLTMHGETHPVELNAEVSAPIQDPTGNRRVGLEATGKLNRKDWGISWNVALEAGGLMVSDTVNLHIEGEAFQPNLQSQAS